MNLKQIARRSEKSTAARIDLHMHTRASDGMSSAEDIVRYAKRYNLTGIAITDHHCTRHPESDKVAAALQAAGIIVYRGCEYSSGGASAEAGGHMLVFGVDVAKLDLGRYALSQDVIDKVNDYGGCVVPSHPFKGYKRRFGSAVAALRDIPAWEGVNGQCTYQVPHVNEQAVDLAAQFNKPMTGGSDAHVAHGLGLSWTEFDQVPLSDHQLVRELWTGLYRPGFDANRATEEQQLRSKTLSSWSSGNA